MRCRNLRQLHGVNLHTFFGEKITIGNQGFVVSDPSGALIPTIDCKESVDFREVFGPAGAGNRGGVNYGPTLSHIRHQPLGKTL